MKEFMIKGFFTKKQCENLIAKLNNKTFYKWQISYGNFAGNCTLIVRSNYDEEIEELKDSFFHFALSELAR